MVKDLHRALLGWVLGIGESKEDSMLLLLTFYVNVISLLLFIFYSVSFYMLTEELEESNRIFSERLSKIEAALNIK